MLRDHTTPICPLPGLSDCVRERCNFWDKAKEECAGDPVEAGSPWDPDGSSVIPFYAE